MRHGSVRAVVGFSLMVMWGLAATHAHAGVDPQACCLTAGGCVDIPPEFCNGTPQGSGTLCSSTMCPTVPTMGTIGLVMTALLMIGAGVFVARKRMSPSVPGGSP